MQARTAAAGYGPWTVKAGVPHVQPPVAVLEQMLTVRVQLDDSDESNGPLRVAAGLARRMGDSMRGRPAGGWNGSSRCRASCLAAGRF